MSTILPTHGVALVQIYNAGLKCAAHGLLKIQDAKNRHMCTTAQLCQAISSQLSHVLTIGKKLLNRNTSSTCPHNMVNLGPLTAEIGWRASKFQRVLHLGSVSQFDQQHSTEGATYIWLGNHHVGHQPTF